MTTNDDHQAYESTAPEQQKPQLTKLPARPRAGRKRGHNRNRLARRSRRPHDGRMDRLQYSAWQYVAEVLPPEELPMLAAHALVDERDSPALRELAGLPPERLCRSPQTVHSSPARTWHNSSRRRNGRPMSPGGTSVRPRERRAEPRGRGQWTVDDGRSPHPGGDTVAVRRSGLQRMARSRRASEMGEGVESRGPLVGRRH